MQGVHPMANTEPSTNAAPNPVRPATSRLPTRSPIPSPSAGASAMPPVVVARPAEAPASSGRHVRSSTGILRMPARLRPITTSTVPPMIRSGFMYSAIAPPAKAAVMPRSVNTVPNPATKARAWRTAAQRDGRPAAASPWAATATAVSWPRYAGTSGRTHGERNETSPAAMATRNV